MWSFWFKIRFHTFVSEMRKDYFIWLIVSCTFTQRIHRSVDMLEKDIKCFLLVIHSELEMKVRRVHVTRHEKKMSIFAVTPQFFQTPSNKGLLTIRICCADTFFHDEMECWGWAERYCSAMSALMESVRTESVISLDLQHIIHYHVLTHVTWWDRSQITYIDIYATQCFPCTIVQNTGKLERYDI